MVQASREPFVAQTIVIEFHEAAPIRLAVRDVVPLDGSQMARSSRSCEKLSVRFVPALAQGQVGSRFPPLLSWMIVVRNE